MERGDLQSVKEILSSGKVDLSRVYVNKELICGEDRIRVRVCCIRAVHELICTGAQLEFDNCGSVEKKN